MWLLATEFTDKAESVHQISTSLSSTSKHVMSSLKVAIKLNNLNIFYDSTMHTHYFVWAKN